MELFAGLMLDRIRIVLQMIDVLVQAIVFFLKLLQLQLKGFRFFPFVGEYGQTIVAKDDAVGHHERQGGGSEGGRATAPQVDAVLRGSGQFGEFAGKLRLLWGDSQVRASRMICG